MIMPPQDQRRLLLILALIVTSAAAWVAGCANDPFDPESLPNRPPVARIFVSPVGQDSLNATSYYKRTFYWSGSDEDGFVVEYYVSVETETGVSAPWDTTTRTDTTMTFATDDYGHAEANIRLACRDDRGALSDTVVQYIPLRNFPPVVNFQADYDSIRWSYGAANFRFFALDLDGNETLSDSFSYKLDTADTTLVRSYGYPQADPALCWVRRAFSDLVDRNFTIELKNIAPAAERTLTVMVNDEARAEARLNHTWEVREAVSPVLLVMDALVSIDMLYIALMDSIYGTGQWSRYEIYLGMPDTEWELLETFRQFETIIWYTSGGASKQLKAASDVLAEYLYPSLPITPPGRMLLVSRAATGAISNLSSGFIQSVLGLSPTASPPNAFRILNGPRQALGLQTWLPAITSESSSAGGSGVDPLTGTEAIYQMEFCRDCYGNRPPFDPIVGVRRPERAEAALARVVVLTLQLDQFVAAEALAALQIILSAEMGVMSP